MPPHERPNIIQVHFHNKQKPTFKQIRAQSFRHFQELSVESVHQTLSSSGAVWVEYQALSHGNIWAKSGERNKTLSATINKMCFAIKWRQCSEIWNEWSCSAFSTRRRSGANDLWALHPSCEGFEGVQKPKTNQRTLLAPAWFVLAWSTNNSPWWYYWYSVSPPNL